MTNIYQGSLFSSDFLTESIVRLPEWSGVDDAMLEALSVRLGRVFAHFPTKQTPNESQTEDDLIWPILESLGWTASLRQQNLTPKGREDVPDGLLFKDAAAKTQANLTPEEWRRYEFGLAVVESKRWNRPLDRRSGRRGEETAPSTQMLRYLRRIEDLTTGKLRWGMLTNGARWRLYYQGARSVAEQFFEIDLAMVLAVAGRDGDLFALTDDERRHWLRVFLLIFRCDSFVGTPSDARTFHQRALDEGRYYEERVAGNLSNLVFGSVFPLLAKAIASAAPDAPLQEVREAAFVLLYRLLFILYAEDRDLLPVRDSRYTDYGLREKVRGDVGKRKDRNDTFSTTAARYWSVIDDLCRAIDKGDSSIGLPPYNGGLFEYDRTPLLPRVRLNDAVMADVIDALSFEQTPEGRRYINYRDLSVQQLGSIYERLLEHEVIREGGTISIRPNIFARKGSGSYYTPDDLVILIIHETIDPLITQRIDAFHATCEEQETSTKPEDQRLGVLKRSDPAEKILDLKICDPAMGSGHFLVSLVDYLADQVINAMAEAEASVQWGPYVSPLGDRIEAIRNTILGNAEQRGWTVDPAQLDDRHIIRRMVLKRCIYGVDKNLMAVELAKVSLWLHTFTVGAPLSFLDHHLRNGDSLFGLWVQGGIKKAAKLGAPLFLREPMTRALRAASPMQIIEGLTDAEIAEAHRSADIFDEVQEMTAPLDALLCLLHAVDWLEFNSRENRVILESMFTGVYGDPVQIAMGKLDPTVILPPGTDKESKATRAEVGRLQDMLAEIRDLTREEHFLNWQVAFAGVWSDWESDKLSGGFDAIIGNPPWDRMKLQQVEWFAARRREIALAQRASDRKRMVNALEKAGDPLAVDYKKAEMRAEAGFRMARTSDDYPLLSGGDVNIYSLFVERAMKLVKPEGVVGLLTPIGIGTDKTSAAFFSQIAEAKRIKAFIAFENRQGWLFSDVHHEDQPTIIVIGGIDKTFADFAFGVKLHAIPSDEYMSSHRMTFETCKTINPNTGTIPIFRNHRDAEITASIYGRLPILVQRSEGVERTWPVRYATMFHMTNAATNFRTKEDLEEKEGAYPLGGRLWESKNGTWEPLFEGKMISLYNHRYASVGVNPANISGQGVAIHSTLGQIKDPDFVNMPRYWVEESRVNYRFPYALGFNDVCNTNNRRSLISALVPRAAYGNKLPILVPDSEAEIQTLVFLVANMNSIVCDYVARQKIQSRNLNKYILEQIPVVPPKKYKSVRFGSKKSGEIIREAVLELTYTAHDMAPFARDMGYVDKAGEVKPPFKWDESRRVMLRAKLDAIYFHLYGITERDDVRYIYSTFPIIERDEMDAHGRCLSRDLCLAWMSALAAGNPDAQIKL
jgi:hypothetical protein